MSTVLLDRQKEDPGRSAGWTFLVAGGLLGAIGGVLLVRGMARRGSHAPSSSPPHRWRDTVNEASEDSFPASDPPSWTPAELAH